MSGLVHHLQAADYGVLKDVLLDDLVEIIALMHNHVKVGCGVILDDEDDETSSSFGQIMIGAEACLAILHIMTADGLSVEVFNEVLLLSDAGMVNGCCQTLLSNLWFKPTFVQDAIESVLEFVNYHLKYNVYVFYDIMQRQKFRPLTYTYNDEQPAAKKTKLGKKRAGVT